ncbi:MAG: DUF1553 domain-containing protein [Planctomycetota bacterium]
MLQRATARIFAIATIFLTASSVSADDAIGLAFFEKEIRPILVSRCYSCHSAEARKLRAGLYLDSKPGWTKGGDSGSPIVPGHPAKSALIEAVLYENSDTAMPPKGKLPQREIDALVKWVAMGAPDPRTQSTHEGKPKQIGLSLEEGRAFWSYRRPVARNVPAVRGESWIRSDLDRFVLAGLEAKGLSPAPEADRATLIRRVYIDLVGLPPSPDDIERFLDDDRDDALERLVDRLLASPRFGERWGRHWLDVTRYAESVVLRGLLLKHAWRYRDYVIAAFNDDMSYRDFVREQLAGDLLGGTLGERQRRRVATTFYSMGDHTLESQDKRQLDMDVVDEQLEVIGKALLAQTITCARCHDHKFDPIPTRDYYALAGILRGVDTLKHSHVSGWVEMPLPLTSEDEASIAASEKRRKELEKEQKNTKTALAKLKSRKAQAPSSQQASAIVAPGDFRGVVLDEKVATRRGEWQHSQWTKRYIGDGYLHDKGEGKGEKSLTFSPKLPRAGVYEVRFAYTPGTNRSPDAPVTVVSADGEKTIIVNERREPPIDGRWVRLGKFRFDPKERAAVRIETTRSTQVVTVDAVQFLSQDDLNVERSKPKVAKSTKPKVNEERATKYETTAARLREIETELSEIRKRQKPRPMVLTVRENKSRDIAVHVRGSVHTLGDVVPRGVLQVTLRDDGSDRPQIPRDQSGRLELADWITSAENPLTARVFVNRAWHWLFGRGLVPTPDNFGTTGQRPTHPELLDHLTLRFVDRGWSVKWLVREICRSQTYRMSSQTQVASRGPEVDPENRLFWKRDRRQLEAECIRDSMLSAAGELDLKMGGQTYPQNLRADYTFKSEEPRRSVYGPVFRNARPEIFEVFDGAHPSMVTGKRDVSTVAPQALFLLNHPFVLKQAARAAKRILALGPPSERVRLAYLTVLGRRPTARELDIGARVAIDESGLSQLIHVLLNSIDFRHLH